MRRSIAFGSLIAIMALIWLGTRPERVRYRITIEVETREGVRTGFSVREIETRNPLPIPMLGEDRGFTSVRGEAVAVDLPDGQVLFGLLKGADGSLDHAGRDMLAIFREHEGAAKDGIIELWPAMPRTSAPRIDNPLPLLVRFRDINDPKSVEEVNPDAIGVRRIVVETTDDAVTTGIMKRLRWLGKFPESRLDRDYRGSTNPTIAQRLANADFRQGTN